MCRTLRGGKPCRVLPGLNQRAASTLAPRCLGSLTRVGHGTPPRMLLIHRLEAFWCIGGARMAHGMWSSEHPPRLPPAYSDAQNIRPSGLKANDCAALTERAHLVPSPRESTKVSATGRCMRGLSLSNARLGRVHTSWSSTRQLSAEDRPRKTYCNGAIVSVVERSPADCPLVPQVSEVKGPAPRRNMFALMIVSHLRSQPSRQPHSLYTTQYRPILPTAPFRRPCLVGPPPQSRVRYTVLFSLAS